jgi:uncharacterized membrane protein YphA (DoxX/SURF4 family)
MNKMKMLKWLLSIIAAGIMLQTLYFKFTGHEQSVKLFTELGMEPRGRIGIGFMELAAAVLLLIPKTNWAGALLGLGLMTGAIFFHLTKLGIYFDGDPFLFVYALITWIACLLLLFLQRKQIFSNLIKLKKLVSISLICLLISSCSKEENTMTAPINDPLSGGTVLIQGNFSGSGGHSVAGMAKIIDNNGVKTVRLENFSATNGPDLKVYLANEINAASFINLGNLKSISGNQNYTLTGMPDIAQFKYVLIWCQQFGVGFGVAELQ